MAPAQGRLGQAGGREEAVSMAHVSGHVAPGAVRWVCPGVVHPAMACLSRRVLARGCLMPQLWEAKVQPVSCRRRPKCGLPCAPEAERRHPHKHGHDRGRRRDVAHHSRVRDQDCLRPWHGAPEPRLPHVSDCRRGVRTDARTALMTATFCQRLQARRRGLTLYTLMMQRATAQVRLRGGPNVSCGKAVRTLGFGTCSLGCPNGAHHQVALLELRIIPVSVNNIPFALALAMHPAAETAIQRLIWCFES